MSNILDKSFKYVPSAATDIRKLFARVRREQKNAKVKAPVTRLPERKKVAQP